MYDYIKTTSIYYLKYGICLPPITRDRCEYILNSSTCDTVMDVRDYLMGVQEQLWDFEYINTYLNYLSIISYYCIYIGFIFGLGLVVKNIYTKRRFDDYTYLYIPNIAEVYLYKTILLPITCALILSCVGPLLISFGMLILFRTIIRVHELPANIKALYKRIYDIVYPVPHDGNIDYYAPIQHHHQTIRDVVHTNFIEDKPDECPICWESLDEVAEPLSCGHYMHKNCLLSGGQTICSICRQEVYLSDDELATIEYNRNNQ